MMSGHVEYQILVVTRLAAFKLAKHRPEDVVQFLVSWGLCQDARKGARGPGVLLGRLPASRVQQGAGPSPALAQHPGVPEGARQ